MVVSLPPSASCFKWWTSKKVSPSSFIKGADLLQHSHIPFAKFKTQATTSGSRRYLVEEVSDFLGFLDPIGGIFFVFLRELTTSFWNEA